MADLASTQLDRIAAIDGLPLRFRAASVVVVELVIVAFERLTRDFLPCQECIAIGPKSAQRKWHQPAAAPSSVTTKLEMLPNSPSTKASVSKAMAFSSAFVVWS